MPIDDALAQLGPSIKYPKIEPTSNSGNYILLPENEYHKDLLVSKERKYLGKNWYQAHEELAKEDSYMLTIRQFVDFLKLLKSGNVYDENKNKILNKESNLILYDILNQKNPVRGEWLDAEFKEIENKLYICYNSKLFLENNMKNKITQLLEVCLMQDKMIDLDYWLANATSNGLPPSNISEGILSYYPPRKNSVAWFWADSDRVYLFCIGSPQGSNPELGVRQVKTSANNL